MASVTSPDIKIAIDQSTDSTIVDWSAIQSCCRSVFS
jgi:hypothetical protein